MPFGATVPGDVLQHKLGECFGMIEQVIIIADDIMIIAYKPDHSDHDQVLPTLFQTAKQCNVKHNYDKLQYKQNEVEFFAEMYTTSGCKPIKDKVAAITSISSPTNKKQVQSFLGMINYLAKFSPRFSELAEPIRELAKDTVPVNWSPEHHAAFIHMKKEIESAPVLAYYIPKKQTSLQTDANIKHIGVCLLQDSKPNSFASKALTDALKGYVAIELESLAVAWAMEKFHHFLYAGHFLLETNQKQLEVSDII